MGTKQTKYERIRQHLMDGNTISSLEAITLFHATRLSAIIYTMIHRDGIDIESRTEVSPDGARYSRYWVSKKFLEQEKTVDHAAAQANQTPTA